MSKVLTLNNKILVTTNNKALNSPAGGGGGNTQSSKSYTVSASGSQTISPDTGYDNMAEVALTVPAQTLPSGNNPTSSTSTGTSAASSIGRSTSNQYLNIPTGYNDTAKYYTISATANGSVTAPTTITGTSATVSTGTNTLTLSKTISVTPNVTTAGYISSGTAGNSSVSLTASITTQAAQNIYPSTSDQTITSGRYLTGTQTIKAVTTTNLIADNIKSGVTITVGDTADADRVASVTGTYSGGGGGSMNVQTAQSTDRRSTASLGSVNSLTCKTTGTYDVYWTCTRSNTSQTWGSQLYLGGVAYGTENQTWSNHVQTNHLTGVSISANTVVAVYGRPRSGYYIYAPQLTIVQTA